MGKEEVAMVACSIFCTSLFVMGLAIPSLMFAYQDEDSTCQQGTRGGLDLSDWLKGFGWEKVGLTAIVYISVGLACIHEVLLVPGFIAVTVDIFFTVVWWIWGIVILATNENNRCVAEGKAMAVMAIINLVLCEVSVGYAVLLAKTKA